MGEAEDPRLGRGGVGWRIEDPIHSLLPLPYSWLQGAGEPLVQSGDSHSPPEAKGPGAPRR